MRDDAAYEDGRAPRDEAAYIVMRQRQAPATYMNIEEQLTLYPELPSDERIAVEAYVSAHPEWQSALEEAKRWDHLLADVRRLGEDPSGDEALAYYVTTRGLQPDQAPEAVKHFVSRIEERIASDPALAARVSEMESRMRMLEEGSPAASQFEALRARQRGSSKSESTHHTPHPARDRERSSRSSRGAAPAGVFGGGPNGRSPGASLAERPRASSGLRSAAVALVVVAALYGVLYVAGNLARPSYERLADFTSDELSLEGYENVRGDSPYGRPPSSVELYVGALHQLRGAQSSYLGLFPGYDAARLDSAATLLRATLEDEPDASFLAGEAMFLLGKTELARGNLDAAKDAFERVISARGRKTAEARRLLEELRS